jgi:mycoredoxin
VGVQPAQTIIMYGTAWCSDCERSKRLLDRYAVPYAWVDIDQDGEAQARVLEINGGMRSVPTIVFPDGEVLVEPSDRDLAAKLGLDLRSPPPPQG